MGKFICSDSELLDAVGSETQPTICGNFGDPEKPNPGYAEEIFLLRIAEAMFDGRKLPDGLLAPSRFDGRKRPDGLHVTRARDMMGLIAIAEMAQISGICRCEEDFRSWVKSTVKNKWLHREKLVTKAWNFRFLCRGDEERCGEDMWQLLRDGVDRHYFIEHETQYVILEAAGKQMIREIAETLGIVRGELPPPVSKPEPPVITYTNPIHHEPLPWDPDDGDDTKPAISVETFTASETPGDDAGESGDVRSRNDAACLAIIDELEEYKRKQDADRNFVDPLPTQKELAEKHGVKDQTVIFNPRSGGSNRKKAHDLWKKCRAERKKRLNRR